MDVMKKDTVEDEAEADDPLWRKKNKIVTKPSWPAGGEIPTTRWKNRKWHDIKLLRLPRVRAFQSHW